jgi:2-amino-4-hydroxy-6-hydroxymethyldihydropteridine diphosphokinase
MPRVYLSLGSNLGDRLALLRAAVQQLQAHGLALVDASPLYESEAWEEEPGRTALRPRDLLDHLQAIETALGRTRTAGLTPEAQRFTPRTVDIDIIFYGDEVISVPDDIHVPHLLAAERAFVLRPLADIAPELTHPTLYRSIRDLLAELADEHEVRPGAYPARWFEEPA